MIKLITIDRDNVDELIDLKVAHEQMEAIAPNGEWIAEACYMPECTTFGIAWEDRPIGLLTLVDPRLAPPEDAENFQPGYGFLWRIMIDHRFQGRGHGTDALTMTMERVEADGFNGLSLATADLEGGNALPFYRKLGFEPTGRRLDGEIELVKHFEKRTVSGRVQGRAQPCVESPD